MFGRQRKMPIYSQNLYYLMQPQPNGSLNYHQGRSRPSPNQIYPQTAAYPPFLGGMSLNGSVQGSPFYSYPNGFPPINSQWQGDQNGYGQNQNLSQLLFENPLQTQTENFYAGAGYQPEVPYQNMNPYPKHSYLSKQPSGLQTVVNSFKNQEGNLDLNKMIDTAGQMMNAVTQVSSMVKGFGGVFKA